jgi:putative hydrolase of HD superfamily
MSGEEDGSEQGLVRILKIAGRLKKEHRRGWVVKVGIPDPESVADHSFRTTLIAMILGDVRGLDTGKMMRMALIHDIGEAIIGDLMPPEAAKLGTKKQNENEAVEEIFSNLPKPLRDKYLNLWQELRNTTSEEAKLVSDADKLEMALQASEYEKQGYPKETLSEFKNSAKQRIHDAKVLKIIQRL